MVGIVRDRISVAFAFLAWLVFALVAWVGFAFFSLRELAVAFGRVFAERRTLPDGRRVWRFPLLANARSLGLAFAYGRVTMRLRGLALAAWMVKGGKGALSNVTRPVVEWGATQRTDAGFLATFLGRPGGKTRVDYAQTSHVASEDGSCEPTCPRCAELNAEG